MKTYNSPCFKVVHIYLCFLLFTTLSVFGQHHQDNDIKFPNILTAHPDVPWPQLGEPVTIKADNTKSIDEIINNDIHPDGSRKHQHYVLERGEVYYYKLSIENDYPLMISAEEGDGPLPVIRPYGPSVGDPEAARAIQALDDLYIQNIHFVGWDQAGIASDNASIRLRETNIECVILNSILEFNRRSLLRIDRENASVYIHNTLFYNAGTDYSAQLGFPVFIRNVKVKHLSLINNTFVNAMRSFIYSYLYAGTEKMIVNHNTFVNSGISGFEFGKPDTLIFTNNLIVNPAILGDGWDGDDNNATEKLYVFTLDSFYLPKPYPPHPDPSTYEKSVIDFGHNHVYIDPKIGDFLPDTSNPSAMFLYDEELQETIVDADSNKFYAQPFFFHKFDIDSSDYKAFIANYYSKGDAYILPGFTYNPANVSFKYDENSVSYSASDNKLPVGDLNWFDTLNVNPTMSDSLVLVSFYKQIEGLENTAWLKAPLKHWEGVTLTDGRVTKLDVSNFGISGSLPASLHLLNQLDTLILMQNFLSGEIPHEIFNLHNLLYLDISQNHFQGTIPVSINKLTSLSVLKLQENSFDSLSTIELVALDSLFIQNNHFTFDDILPNVNAAQEETIYGPQKFIGKEETKHVFIDEEFSLHFPDIHPDNVYKWYKKGVEPVVNTTNPLQFNYFAIADTGTYYCRVTNPGVAGLMLESASVKLVEHDSLKLIQSIFYVHENIALGTVIGTLSPNLEDSVEVTLVNASAFFEIDTTSGDIRVIDTLDYESLKLHELQVRIALQNHKNVVDTFLVKIHIQNINEAPEIINVYTLIVFERSPSGTVIGQVTAIDPDLEDDITYYLYSNLYNIFSIDPQTGEIAVNDSSYLDYGTQPELTIVVGVRDNQPDALDDTVKVRVLIQEVSSTGPLGNHNEIKVYPNPASDKITISVSKKVGDAVEEVRLISTSGRKLQVHTRDDLRYPEITLELSKYQSGMYIVQIVTKEKIYSLPVLKK